jgi:hypothetical protein
LQKSPSSLCEIEICNDRIGARAPLNRCCAFAPDLESMLRDKMLKILLQHNRMCSGNDVLAVSLVAEGACALRHRCDWN